MKRPYYLIQLILLVISSVEIFAQHQNLHERPETWQGKMQDSSTINTVSDAFKKGSVQGHFRHFSMYTHNKGELSDYNGHAIGGGLKFESAPFRKVQFGVSGFYIFNLISSDLSLKDRITDLPNRYEIALFDITDLSNVDNIDRLEELYLRYKGQKTEITFGKQLINTPFINLQDGRMRPTEVEGLNVEFQISNKLKIMAYYLYKISPRSTVVYYDIASSIGIYSSGLATDGQKSNYAGQLSSKGVFMLAAQNAKKANFQYKVWNMFVENIFNTSFAQLDYSIDLSSQSSVFAGVQGIYQTAINQGGNNNGRLSNKYYDPSQTAKTLGAQIGWAKKYSKFSINYNRIFSTGRYLMPREWGRDPFYTFMPRERNEGLGDVNAFVIHFDYRQKSIPLFFKTSLGYFDLPNPNNAALNKYSMPSYTQVNVDLAYKFAKKLRGFDIHLLYVYKKNMSKVPLTPSQMLNKVEMGNLNVITNFHF